MKLTPLLVGFLLIAFAARSQSTYSLRFWGQSDFVHIENCPDARILGNLTLMFDIRMKDTTDWSQIICLGDDTSSLTLYNTLYSVEISPGGDTLRYRHEYSDEYQVVHKQEIDFAVEIPFNEWTHITLVRESSKKRIHLYKESELISTQIYLKQPVGGTSGHLTFGHALGDPYDYLNALIDNVSVWYTAMEPDDVVMYSNCLPKATDPHLVTYWTFNEGTGNVVGDIVNGNNGILYGTNANWRTQTRPYFNCSAGISTIQSDEKELIRIVDLMGREITEEPNKILIYLYSDGSMERIFRAE